MSTPGFIKFEIDRGGAFILSDGKVTTEGGAPVPWLQESFDYISDFPMRGIRGFTPDRDYQLIQKMQRIRKVKILEHVPPQSDGEIE